MILEAILTLTQIAISFSIGMFIGAFILFRLTCEEIKELEDSLDKCHQTINSYTNKYEDDGYEAY